MAATAGNSADDFTVVLDDDPTGAQLAAGISVVLAGDAMADAVQPADGGVHVLTNTRALVACEARRTVRDLALAARTQWPRARIVLRGDSTLRGHLLDEYRGLGEALGVDSPPLLLVPALPTAGRVTIDGVHMQRRDGAQRPLSGTEYAGDGEFAYSSSDLATWAHERSGGVFDAGRARHVPLAELRGTDGARAVAAAIAEAGGQPSVVIPDAETAQDLEVIAAGLRLAESRGVAPAVRCGPAFATVLTRSAAPAAAPMPRGRRLLVLSGSFVPTTARQLAALQHAVARQPVTADVQALARADAAEIAHLADDANALIESDGIAVVATPTTRDPAHIAVEHQHRIASSLARVAGAVRADVIIAKGGITAAVIATEGLAARFARVLGPVRPGVARWALNGSRPFVVVPGNLGEDDLLADLVRAARAEPVSC